MNETTQDAAPPQQPDLGPLYVGQNQDGSHQVQMPDGNLLNLSFDSLTPQLQNDAVQSAAVTPANPNGGPNLFQIGTGGPVDAALHGGTIGDQQQTIQNALGAAPAGEAGAPQLTAQPPAPVTQQPAGQTPAPPVDVDTKIAPVSGGGGGGGGGGSNIAQQTTDAQTKAEAAQRDVATELAKKQLAVGQSTSEDQLYEQQMMELRRQATDKQTQDILQKHLAIADDFAKAKIDPHALWNSKSDGDKALARVAMIIGGLFSGATGGKNLAVEAYARDQDEDIAKQKFNIEHGKEAGEAYSKLLSDTLAISGDHRLAHDSAAAMINEKKLQGLANAALETGGPAAQAKFLAETAPLRQANNQKAADAAKTYADAQQARAGAAHLQAETQGLQRTNQVGRDLQDAQAYLSNGGTYAGATPAHKRALLQNAQGNEMMMDGVGLTTRKVTADDNQKQQDLETINGILADTDALAKHTALDPDARIRAAGNAQTLKVLLPKVLGSQARLSPGAEQALDRVVPENPGDLTTFWKSYSKEIGDNVDKTTKAFHKNLGLTPFVSPPSTFKPD